MSDQIPPAGPFPAGPSPVGSPIIESPVFAPQPALPPAGLPLGPPPTPPMAPRVIVTQRRGLGVLGTILIAAVVAAVVGSFAGLAGYMIGRSVDQVAAPTAVESPSVVLPQAAAGTSPRSDGSISGIAASTLPAVVSIISEGATQAGEGSGFVVRPNGYIITNNHVVAPAADGGTLTVVFSDGVKINGKVVGTSPSYDIAVVKVERTGLATVPLGNSSNVQVGDTAIVIGAPLGLEGTVTSGIVSALDRPVTPGGAGATDASFINAIQTDAAINPGNSGGPLLNGAGEVIGVTSAISSVVVGQNGEAGNVGLGFAIPINSAKRIAEELISTGKSRTPIMGVKLDMAYSGSGAKILSVTAKSPADQAGLRADDIIVTVNGRTIDDATELVVEIRNHAPGEKIKVDYTRGGQDSSTSLSLGDDSTAG